MLRQVHYLLRIHAGGQLVRLRRSDLWLYSWNILFSDAWDLDADSAAQLSALEQILRPEKVVDQVRAIALSENLIAAGLGSDDDKNPDGIADTMRRIADKAENLGRIAGTVQLCLRFDGEHGQEAAGTASRQLTCSVFVTLSNESAPRLKRCRVWSASAARAPANSHRLFSASANIVVENFPLAPRLG